MQQDPLVNILSKSTEGKLECIYLVDGETRNNVLILMRQTLNDKHVVIPFKYRKYVSRLINLTNSKKNLTFYKLLKIKPLRPVFSYSLDKPKIIKIDDGMAFVTDDDDKDELYNRKRSYLGELTFGENRGSTALKPKKETFDIEFDPTVAAKQLRDNFYSIKDDIKRRTEQIWVIARYDDAQNTKLYFAQLTAYEQTQPNTLESQQSLKSTVVSLPPRVPDTTINRSSVPPSSISSSASSIPQGQPPPVLSRPISSSTLLQPVLLTPRSNEPTIWNEYFNDQNQPYYHNPISNITQWDRPNDNVTINVMKEEPLAAIQISNTRKTSDNLSLPAAAPVAAPPPPPFLTPVQLAEEMKKGKLSPEKRVPSQRIETNIRLPKVLAEPPRNALINAINQNPISTLKSKSEREQIVKDANEKKYSRTKEELQKINAFFEKFSAEEENNRKYDDTFPNMSFHSENIKTILNIADFIANRKSLIKVLKEIVANNKDKDANNELSKIENNIQKLLIEENEEQEAWGDKKYYNKYLKYKQKYLEAKKLYGEELQGEELVGGFPGEHTFIFCTNDVITVINNLYDKNYSRNTFRDKDFFNFIMGPRSFYTEGKKKDLCFCSGSCMKNFWDEGLGGKFYFTLDDAKKQIEEKIGTGTINITIEGEKTTLSNYGYFYYYSNFSKDFTITFV